jgi:hypothetical protein
MNRHLRRRLRWRRSHARREDRSQSRPEPRCSPVLGAGLVAVRPGVLVARCALGARVGVSGGTELAQVLS